MEKAGEVDLTGAGKAPILYVCLEPCAEVRQGEGLGSPAGEQPGDGKSLLRGNFESVPEGSYGHRLEISRASSEAARVWRPDPALDAGFFIWFRAGNGSQPAVLPGAGLALFEN